MHKEIELTAKLAEIGSQLRQMREIKALSLEEVQVATLISKNHLQAIEDGNLAQLPEPVYIHGFIRKYGQMIGLANLAEDFPIDPLPLTKNVVLPWKPELRPWHLYALYVGLVIGSIVLLSTFFRDPLPKNNDPAPNLSKSAQLESPPQPTRPPKTIDSPSPKQPVLLPVTGPLLISVTMKGESWLRVTVDDQLKFEGILAEGDQQSWSGNREIIFRSGNAAAVNLTFNKYPPQILGNEGEVIELIFDKNYQPIPPSITPTAQP